jgi:hypothetical protein
MSEGPKDDWDKAKVILGPVGGLLTAVAVVVVGFVTNQQLAQRQDREGRVRLYSELMSRREDAESQLRKDMFQSIIASFLSDTAARLKTKVLHLELLAYNFHESLDLSPVFHHLLSEIGEAYQPDARKQEFRERLARVAGEIARKQMLLLEGAGESFETPIDLASVQQEPEGFGVRLPNKELEVDNIARTFQVTVLAVDPIAQEVRVRLEIAGPYQPNGKSLEHSEAEFWVGFFDFPMIQNTRLSYDQRCAVVLTAFSATSANIRVIYFPGSHASLRERAYFQEIVDKLLASVRRDQR